MPPELARLELPLARVDPHGDGLVDAGYCDAVARLGGVDQVVVAEHADSMRRLALRDGVWVLLRISKQVNSARGCSHSDTVCG